MRKLGLLLGLWLAGCAALAQVPANLLEPEKAFQFSARALDARTLEVRFAIADGYYLYRERFRFSAAGAKLGAAQYPPGLRKHDQFFGEVETYRKEVRILLPAEGAGRVDLSVVSQGCADVGVCYVPMESKTTLQLASFGASGTSETYGASGAPSRSLSIFSSDLDIAALFQGNLLLVIASFLGFGLLLAFTPCVLPMIPILSGIIVGEGRDLNKLRAFILLASYVLGMAVAYSLAGVAAAYSGNLIAASLQNPWVLVAFALVFVWLAAVTFGLHDLRLPSFLHHRLSAAHHKLEGGRVASVAAMGVLSAVIVSPCVAAPLAGALLYISQTRDVALGGAALFAMALGMGVPLLVVGVSEGALIPRTGPWVKRVKHFFGVLLLGVAAWIVWPVLVPAGAQTRFERIGSAAALDEKLRAPGKPVMLDFYADWCVSCKEMEAFTFSDPRVKARMDAMLLLQADVTANTPEHRELLKRFSLFGPPGIVFFDAEGREIQGLRVIGYQNPERFLKNLSRASSP